MQRRTPVTNVKKETNKKTKQTTYGWPHLWLVAGRSRTNLHLPGIGWLTGFFKHSDIWFIGSPGPSSNLVPLNYDPSSLAILKLPQYANSQTPRWVSPSCSLVLSGFSKKQTSSRAPFCGLPIVVPSSVGFPNLGVGFLRSTVPRAIVCPSSIHFAEASVSLTYRFH